MSARTHTKKQQSQSEIHSSEVGRASHPAKPLSPAIVRACTLIKKADYAGAANVLAAAGRDAQVRNALGVCLMRSGRAGAAVELYRSFVLSSGSLLERHDVSNAYKRNFATALLLTGLPSGTLAVLKNIREPLHPNAVRLYTAIKNWEKSLSWWRRLDWKLNAIEPRKCHVPIDFEPGEFDFDVEPQRPAKPDSRSKIAA